MFAEDHEVSSCEHTMDAGDVDEDQQVVLEELYDENYEPTEAGAIYTQPPKQQLLCRTVAINNLCCLQRYWSMLNGWAWTQRPRR